MPSRRMDDIAPVIQRHDISFYQCREQFGDIGVSYEIGFPLTGT